ncbi:sigma-70 family RNA polymerase sigma factor [Planctomycetota bacterium]|nr:sigma-70 family RNA polymerase sigma factor [Planctomycetota bacterium]
MTSETHWTNIWEAREGDDDALRVLCEKYRPAVLAYIRHHGLGEEAEDVAQETMLALLEALGRVDPAAGRFRALVYAIARKKMLKHRRRERAQKRGAGRVQQWADFDSVADQSPDEDFDYQWVASLVAVAMTKLEEERPAYHRALKAITLDERTYTDLAAEEGVSEGALRKRVMRARQKLAGLLAEEVWFYGRGSADVDPEVAYLTQLVEPRLRD